MEVDFGLLPMYKLDEQQDMYKTFIHSWASDCLAIPTCVKAPKMSANVFEYIAFTSMSTLKPAYYEKALTYKAMRDEESVEMLDYHLAGRILDYGYIADVGMVYSSLKNSLTSGKNDLSSLFQKRMKSGKRLLEKYMEPYLNME